MSFVLRKCINSTCNNTTYRQWHQKDWAIQCRSCADKLKKRMLERSS